MSDIVEQLRLIRRDGRLDITPPKQKYLLHPVCQAAADEIERLREALGEIGNWKEGKYEDRPWAQITVIKNIAKAALKGQL